jgi:hypothetical protein
VTRRTLLGALVTVLWSIEVFTGQSPANAADAPAGKTKPADSRRTVLLEAEGFHNLGGWVVDSQFMDQMGSPFLLAHGLGTPVRDAITTATFPTPGTYRVWVRTRDWVAPWHAPGKPGRFQVLVDGKALPTTFGVEGEEWHWQPGGTVQISAQQAKVAMHDLTGFEGRCDAILFSLDNLTPPNKEPQITAFRRKLLGLPEKRKDGGKFDLVVVGGGMAGTCAALSAARLGLSVVLVQDRPVLAGNNSSEVRVWLNGARNMEPWPRVGDIVAELEPKHRAHPGAAEIYEDQRRIDIVRAEKNIKLMLGWRVNGVETADGRIASVTAQDALSGRRVRLCGTLFADCTGDAAVGFLAGADCKMTTKGHMGPTNLWSVVDTGKPSPFPRCPWACDLSQKPFPADLAALGQWFWESGFDHDPIADAERIRDTNFRGMYGAWDVLKNVRKKLPNHRLNWAAYVAGKRESRRLMGDVVLSKADFVGGKKYPDGCVITGWSMDLHLADKRYNKGFESDPFISVANFGAYKRPFWIPYRCFYSRNVPNLFMAGRDISVTHEGLGPVRVMRTCGLMGEIVGMAASLCKQHDTSPRGVYETYLDELKDLMARGAGKIHGQAVKGN